MDSKCCSINVGMLKTRVYLEKKTRTADGRGGFVETWAEDPPGGVMADVRILTGTERYEGMRMVPGLLIRLTMRFRGDAYGSPYWSSISHRLRIRNRIYGILAISDMDFERRWVVMDALENRPS